MKINAALILFLVLVTSSCSVKYSVESATVQDWVGGAAGSGGGMKYSLTIHREGKSELTIDQVWVGDRKEGVQANFRLYEEKENRTMKAVPPAMERFRIQFDVQTRRRTGRDDPGGFQGATKVSRELPAEFERGVIVDYHDSKGNNGMWVVEEFERLETLYHP